MGLVIDRTDWPVHQPITPGGHYWYSGCDPDGALVNPDTGICEGCNERACPQCGRTSCPDCVAS